MIGCISLRSKKVSYKKIWITKKYLLLLKSVVFLRARRHCNKWKHVLERLSFYYAYIVAYPCLSLHVQESSNEYCMYAAFQILPFYIIYSFVQGLLSETTVTWYTTCWRFWIHIHIYLGNFQSSAFLH